MMYILRIIFYVFKYSKHSNENQMQMLWNFALTKPKKNVQKHRAA